MPTGAWQDVNITTPFESSIAKNKYNRIEFDRVTTTRLRLYVTVRSGAEQTASTASRSIPPLTSLP